MLSWWPCLCSAQGVLHRKLIIMGMMDKLRAMLLVKYIELGAMLVVRT